MKVDFTQPMTCYELLAIIISILALLIPLIVWAYNKFLKVTKLNFYPSDKIQLYFNKSGSYLQLGGTFESKNKSTVIKNINIDVIKHVDKSTFNFDWSTLISPIFQKIGNDFVKTSQNAHAFKIN